MEQFYIAALLSDLIERREYFKQCCILQTQHPIYDTLLSQHVWLALDLTLHLHYVSSERKRMQRCEHMCACIDSPSKSVRAHRAFLHMQVQVSHSTACVCFFSECVCGACVFICLKLWEKAVWLDGRVMIRPCYCLQAKAHLAQKVFRIRWCAAVKSSLSKSAPVALPWWECGMPDLTDLLAL